MNTFLLMLNKVVAVLLSVFLAPLAMLTDGLDAISASERTDATSVNIFGVEAYYRSQGVTTDGETLYFSSKTTLIRTEADGETTINANYFAISDELSEEYGIKHIGGLSYYNGYIYAGLEDSKVWDYPIIGVYDAETLELVEYYIMDSEIITRGMPWVSVNPENGYLYCMDHSKNPTKILIYDTANEMAFVDEVELEESVYAIQGAEFYNGMLYAATNDDTQAIYKVDPTTGSVSKVLDRNLTYGSEGEGMTFMEIDGETVIVAIDMGPIFVNAFVRTYNFE